MIERLVVKAIISFVLGQIEKLKGSLDWVKLKADLEKHVRDLVPGTWFDDLAVQMVDSVFDGLKGVLDQGDNIKHLLELLAAKQYIEAMEVLKGLLLGAIGQKIVPTCEKKETTYCQLLA